MGDVSTEAVSEEDGLADGDSSPGVGVAIVGPQAATNNARIASAINQLCLFPMPIPFRFEFIPIYASSTRRSRSELLTTKILLNAIAPAASTGCKRMPSQG